MHDRSRAGEELHAAGGVQTSCCGQLCGDADDYHERRVESDGCADGYGELDDIPRMGWVEKEGKGSVSV